MTKMQCKMCGGMVELADGQSVGECPYCGSTTTFPKVDSERLGQQFDRAEHYRHAGEFDKAVALYEAIIRDQPDEAEAYWGLVLSKFGIEYVEDPVSHERVPTCHRVQYDSILADADYLSALEHAGAAERDIYEAEAKRIAEIQKGILAISAQEKPFDVFICYKETTDGGSRTKDSAIAQDIYYQLTNAGYKVFFARITLEGKLGQQYEPYIFAALNSAKVMLVIGSKKEYFNAVWVKNEWSRFLALMKKDRSRLLIPCYRDMDAYDIPDELSMLQSQDMSKIGFIQDLLRGIKKVVNVEEATGNSTADGKSDSAVAPLLKRIAIFMETGDYAQAQAYCNKVLDKEPENAKAYLLLLLAENQLKSEEKLYMLPSPLETRKNFQLAMKFADAPLKARLQAQVQLQATERHYENLLSRQVDANQIAEYLKLAEEFGSLGGYKDSAQRKQACEQQAETMKQEACEAFQKTVDRMRDLAAGASTPEEWEELAKIFRGMADVPGAAGMADTCEENRTILLYNNFFDEMNALSSKGDSTMDEWHGLAAKFDSLKEAYHCPQEAAEMARQCYEYGKRAQYQKALEFRRKKECLKAIGAFAKIEDYADSKRHMQACWSLVYRRISIILAIVLVVVIMVLVFAVQRMNVAAAEAGRWPYLVVNLQTWKIRHSSTGPDLSDDTCRTTELWLRRIRPGTFMMGSPKDELERANDETQHPVTLTQGYYIGVFEVTQKQFELIADCNRSGDTGDTRPVERVSYDDIRGTNLGAGWPSGGHAVDADSFLGKLRARTGLEFDLPTEAQWEYACRAGTTTALNSGKNLTAEKNCPNMAEVGRYANRGHTKVGSYLPNAWGLYDMHGNVWEWCLDWRGHGDYPSEAATDPQGLEVGSARVLRGGSWYNGARSCRSACRHSNEPSRRREYFGFRLVCPL